MKSRLTITIDEATLAKVDHLIDKKTIRNRSHAIEHLIEQSLSPQTAKAVILAGGADDRPTFEPLTQLNDRPLIAYTLDLLQQHGVRDVYIATNKKGKELPNILNPQYPNMALHFAFEDTPKGTAGTIRQFKKELENQAFFVIAGDVLTNIDLTELARFHRQQEANITMAVKPRPSHQAYDNVYVQGSAVVDFKSSRQDEVVGIVNAGVYVFGEKFFQELKKTDVSLEKDLFPRLANSKTMVAFTFQGIWFDISNDSNYQQAVAELQ